MPISVRCQCGHALQVPDAAAGKSGKCPKCGQAIRIPAAAGTAAVGGKPATAKSAAPASKTAGAKKPAPAGPPSAIDQLFDTAGIGKQQGPTCPSCGAAVKPGAAICVECGYHFERGQKLAGHQMAVSTAEFRNRKLQTAAEDLKRDQELDKRIKRAGLPWWVMLSIVLGLMFVTLAGVMQVDAATNGVTGAKGTLTYAMQKMPFVTLIPFVVTCIAALVVVLSFCALVVAAFKNSAGQGIAVFIPGYSWIYALMHRRELGTTANMHIIWVPILIGFGYWFYANKGLSYFR